MLPSISTWGAQLPLLGLPVWTFEGTGRSDCAWLEHTHTSFPIPRGARAIISIRSLFLHFLPH